MEVITVNDQEVCVADMPGIWTTFEQTLEANPGACVTMFSIGSLWAGQKSRPIGELFDILKKEPLRSDLEMYDCFQDFKEAPFNEYGKLIWPKYPEVRRVWGNFENVSFGFSFETNDHPLLGRLKKAFTKNMAAPSYRKVPAALRPEFDQLLSEKRKLYSLLSTKEYTSLTKQRVQQIYARLHEIDILREETPVLV